MVSASGTPMLSKLWHTMPGKLRAASAATAVVLPTPETPVTTKMSPPMRRN
jgi:hypothetical protein